jgi:superoxide dismutase, Cu-Zn family
MTFTNLPKPLLGTAVAMLLALPATAQQQPAPDTATQPADQQPASADNTSGEEPEVMPATFVNADGEEVGSVAIREVAAGGLIFDINIEGLPPGQWVGFHVHEEGVCDPADGFDSAGGHFNPTGAEHGYFVEGGPHAGDMPNQFIPEGGLLRAQVHNHMVELEGGTGVRGRSLMIHGDADDYESQPSGDAGGRIACAVVE